MEALRNQQKHHSIRIHVSDSDDAPHAGFLKRARAKLKASTIKFMSLNSTPTNQSSLHRKSISNFYLDLQHLNLEAVSFNYLQPPKGDQPECFDGEP